MPSSDHLRPRLNREILGRVLLFLWFRSIGAAKSDPNLCANSVNLFLREPLAVLRNCTGQGGFRGWRGLTLLALPEWLADIIF